MRAVPIASLCILLAACPASTPTLPYPAFVETDELPDTFMATLPGVRAKRYAEDYASRTGRYRIDLPAEWKGTSGGVPDAALEIYVIAGELMVGDFKLIPGGYAYLPSGGFGFRLSSASGARVLWFMSAEPSSALIRAPIINDGVTADWTELAPGVSVRELRFDPGSGARTWLQRTTSEAAGGWRSLATAREGYLVSGSDTVSECVEGKVRTGTYEPGGYFLRTANAVYGGGKTATETGATWFYRQLENVEEQPAADCG